MGTGFVNFQLSHEVGRWRNIDQRGEGIMNAFWLRFNSGN